MDVQWHPWVPWDAGFFSSYAQTAHLVCVLRAIPLTTCSMSGTSTKQKHWGPCLSQLCQSEHIELEANCSTVLQLNGLPNKQNRSTSITVVKHTSSSRRTVITMTRKSRYLFCPSIDQMHYLSSAYFKRIQNNCFGQGETHRESM